jgi:ABC-type phosphate/phosphonate transport system substrate-binding protein
MPAHQADRTPLLRRVVKYGEYLREAEFMIANARMYSVTPAVGTLWRRLLEGIVEQAGQAVEVVEWPAPQSLVELWGKPDKAAVFMCGLPFSLASPQPEIVAAPVPALPRSGGQPVYWSDLVVRADSTMHQLSETFGQRIAFTSPGSQSGYAAPLHLLMQASEGRPLYREVIAPRLTPYGALTAVTEGLAEVAPIDTWAFALLQRYAPDLTAKVRVIASTDPTPIPLLMGSSGQGRLFTDAFLAAHDDPVLKSVMDELLIERFVRPQTESYDILKQTLETAQNFWRQQPLAETTHPAFALEPGAGNS